MGATFAVTAGDKPGPNRTMTRWCARLTLNTGVMFVLRVLGGMPDKFTGWQKTLYNYFKHFGFGVATGAEQSGETATDCGQCSLKR